MTEIGIIVQMRLIVQSHENLLFYTVFRADERGYVLVANGRAGSE